MYDSEHSTLKVQPRSIARICGTTNRNHSVLNRVQLSTDIEWTNRNAWSELQLSSNYEIRKLLWPMYFNYSILELIQYICFSGVIINENTQSAFFPVLGNC